MINFSTTHTAKVSLQFLLNVGQYLGFFPTFHNYFKWRSWRVFYVIFIASSSILFYSVTFIWIVKQTTKWSLAMLEVALSRIAFSINTILIFYLAIQWPKLMKEWCYVDKAMNRVYGHPKHLPIMIMGLSAFFLVLGIIVFVIRYVALYSELSEKVGGTLSIAQFLEMSQSYIFWFISFHFVTAVLLQMLAMSSSLLPTYTDVLLIAVSAILACRFRQLTTSLKQKQALQIKEPRDNFSFWKNFRKDYCRLSSLLFAVDDLISPAIIFSYGSNFVYLLHFLTDFLRNTEHNSVLKAFNYLIAISFLLRMVCLTVMSSWINEESQEPVKILNSVERDEYNAEVSRLLLQLSFDEVALTGCKLFKLNKKLFLSVMSAVITYELMIIQYHNSYVDVNKNSTS